jgi:hypothetical protein
MKRTLIATILMGVAFAALPALAADHETLLVFSFHPGGPQFTGSFNASGALHEAGAADSTVSVDPASGILSASKVIHLTGGDIEMSLQGPLNTANWPAVSLTGKWRFTGGTGVYRGVSGRGTCVVVGDMEAGTFSGAYQGKVKLAGDEGDD